MPRSFAVLAPDLDDILEEKFQARMVGLSFFEWEEMTPLQRRWFYIRYQRHQQMLEKQRKDAAAGTSTEDSGLGDDEAGRQHRARLLAASGKVPRQRPKS